MQLISLTPIGVMRSALALRGQSPPQGPAAGLTAVIEIDPTWRPGLSGLEPGRDLWVIYHYPAGRCDPDAGAPPPRPEPAPDRRLQYPRPPSRPAPLGLTLVRLFGPRGGLAYAGRGQDQPEPKEEP